MSDVREAAERLREFKANYSYEYRNTQMGADCQKLAEAYLEQNPADDEELVDLDFCKSLGAKVMPDVIADFGDVLSWNTNGTVYIFDDDINNGVKWPVKITTRGQLRQLLKVLGVKN